jgi:ferrous iron transport protein A
MQNSSEWQHQVSPKTLSDLPVGARGVVRGLCGGKGFIGRVAVLGFTVGAEVTAIQNYGRGPVIVAVRDTRVALGRGEAAKIQVEVMRET